MPLDTDDLGKIQAMFRDAMPRTEYENRHLELVTRVTRLEDRQENIARLLMEGLEKTRKEREADSDKLNSSVQAVRDMVQALKDELSNSKGTTIRYIVSVIVSFFIGSGIIGILEFVRSLIH